MLDLSLLHCVSRGLRREVETQTVRRLDIKKTMDALVVTAIRNFSVVCLVKCRESTRGGNTGLQEHRSL